jgi:hypothetical protein
MIRELMVSDPIETGANPADTLIAEPDEEPPGFYYALGLSISVERETNSRYVRKKMLSSSLKPPLTYTDRPWPDTAHQAQGIPSDLGMVRNFQTFKAVTKESDL